MLQKIMIPNPVPIPIPRKTELCFSRVNDLSQYWVLRLLTWDKIIRGFENTS